jgi:hypothetical protein
MCITCRYGLQNPENADTCTNEQLLAELTNLRESQCATDTMYTRGGLNRLQARFTKWHGDAIADIKEQETLQATN